MIPPCSDGVRTQYITPIAVYLLRLYVNHRPIHRTKAVLHHSRSHCNTVLPPPLHQPTLNPRSQCSHLPPVILFSFFSFRSFTSSFCLFVFLSFSQPHLLPLPLLPTNLNSSISVERASAVPSVLKRPIAQLLCKAIDLPRWLSCFVQLHLRTALSFRGTLEQKIPGNQIAG